MIYIIFNSEFELNENFTAIHDSYLEMIENTVFDGHSILNMHHVNHGFNYAMMLREWSERGNDLWGVMTKGQDDDLSDQLNSSIHFGFMTCIKTYVSTMRGRHLFIPNHNNEPLVLVWSETDTLFLKQILISTMKEFICDTEHMFHDRYFTLVNDEDDEEAMCYVPDHIVYKRPFKLAMAMGMHRRLGSECSPVFRELGADILRMIWSMDTLNILGNKFQIAEKEEKEE